MTLFIENLRTSLEGWQAIAIGLLYDSFQGAMKTLKSTRYKFHIIHMLFLMILPNVLPVEFS